VTLVMKWRSACLLVLLPGMVYVSGAVGGEVKKLGELTVSSPVFVNNGTIPAKYTCDGADISLPIRIGNVPAASRSMALIVDDPDAPVGTWVHWVVWNIDPGTREIGEGKVPTSGIEGRNDWGRNGYGGPCPPSGAHRYYFRLYALDASLTLPSTTTKKELERAMDGHILARGQLIGIYKRP
jgi:Raf kinase inhibitor-like YbhB/YbcL family protein